jgi:hypothetical protein
MDFYKILRTLDTISEGSMEKAKNKPTGPKFVGKAGPQTTADQAKRKLVGCSLVRELDSTSREMTMEWKLREAYKKFVAEYGMTDGGMTTPATACAHDKDPTDLDPAEQQAATKDAGDINATLTSLSTKTNINDPKKLATALTKANTDQPLNSSDEDATAELAPAIADITKNPQLAGQFNQLVGKAQAQDKLDKLKTAQQQAQQTSTPG